MVLTPRPVQQIRPFRLIIPLTDIRDRFDLIYFMMTVTYEVAYRGVLFASESPVLNKVY